MALGKFSVLLASFFFLLLQVRAATELPTADDELEASIAAMVEGDGEDTTGRSGSSGSSVNRRLKAVCDDARTSFRDMTENSELEEVYSDFVTLYKKPGSNTRLLYDKIVPSEYIKFS